MVKTEEELKLMKISGKICAEALKKVLAAVKIGTSLRKLDRIAEYEIKKSGATSSFMTVEDYAHTICTTVNEQVVHGIPTERMLKNGDVLGIDVGALYKGFHSDMAISKIIGNASKEIQRFVEIGRQTLDHAITQARVGNKIGDISAIIQKEIEGAGYSIVKSLTGHGVGRKLHEEPYIPGFGKRGTGHAIEENMVLAIEVIYTQGSGEVKLENDGWTITSTDGSIGGLFEKTVAVKKDGPIVLTPYL